MKNKVVAIVGMCGTGKSDATEWFVERGWQRIYFGQVTMDELKERGLEKNEKNERSIREELRRNHGPAAFAKLLLPSIERAAEEGPTILDGLYSWSEYKCLKQHFGDDITVAAIITDRSVRYERLTTREIRPLTYEEAESRDYAEIENLEKGGPISIADRFILNNGDVEALNAQVSALIEEFSK
jgi:dephospho-CoA kinase